MSVQRVVFEDRGALAAALAESIGADLASAVKARGEASLVVSGGSTPKPLFEALCQLELPWEKVGITLADERWVPADHEASNEGMVRSLLLRNRAAKARFVGLWNGAPSPEAGADAVAEALDGMARPFDVLVLGMGGDGHTASLFPGAAELADGLDLERVSPVVAVRPSHAPHARLSLSLRALLDSRRIVLHVTGEEKYEVLERALGDGAEEELPIRAVLRRAEVEVYWAS
jgi:6-phosphogluconolactonase